ncbi:serine/threonine protein kinase [Paraburkholderia humisilvae]|uniref:Protein kinase domain-containing protein n=1 Tax=Paraburkholderia humisilvae TaxID=627669 RepID=A0A6J5FCZ9_9BURK|nr:serine/threonine-protein kinase [Paraburkholderia humisilvae]CAB3775146.1 hypothetical protein LMG29542_08528 [Paraburkholderia humisilvae]
MTKINFPTELNNRVGAFHADQDHKARKLEQRVTARNHKAQDFAVPRAAESVAIIEAAHGSPSSSSRMVPSQTPHSLAIVTFLSALLGGGFAGRASTRSHWQPESNANGIWTSNQAPFVPSQRVEVGPGVRVDGRLSVVTILLPAGRSPRNSSSFLRARSNRAANPESQGVVIPLVRAHSRRELASRALLEAGLDPQKKYDVRDIFPTGSEVPGDADVELSMSLLDIYVEHGKIKIPALARRVKDAPDLSTLPDLDTYFDSKFERMMKVQEADVTNKMRGYLHGLGINVWSTPATVFSVGGRSEIASSGSPFFGVSDGRYGYIVDIGKGDSKKSYAASMLNGELVIDKVTDLGWTSANLHKFFGYRKKSPALKRSLKDFVRTTDAVKFVAKRLVDATKGKQWEHAFQRTETERYVDEYRMEIAAVGAGMVPVGAALKKTVGVFKATSTASKGVTGGSRLYKAATNIGAVKSAAHEVGALKKIVGTGVAGKVYQSDGGYLIKVYNNPIGIKNGKIYQSNLDSAKNSAKALKRLYGEDSAKVVLKDGPYPTQSIVTLQMKRIPGESLETILNGGNPEIIEEVLRQSRDKSTTKALIDRLQAKGIVHHDINLGNILYDSKTRQFNLIDFDRATFDPLTSLQSADMLRKLEFDFAEFSRRSGLLGIM